MSTECAAFQEMIQRRLDGETPGSDDRALAAHLSECADCQDFARDLQRIAGVMERLPRERAPHGFVTTLMQQLPAPQANPIRQPAWLAWLGRSWAPLAGLVGVMVLLYQTVAVHGVSLLTLPRALSEWGGLIDLSRIDTLFQATSLFAWSVGAELLLGVSLVSIAIFATMARVMSRPPAIHMAPRRS